MLLLHRLHVEVFLYISVSGAVHPGGFHWRKSGRTCNFPRLIATVRSQTLIINDTIHASNTVSLLFSYIKSGEFTSDENLLLNDSFRVRVRSHEHNEVLFVLQQRWQL